MRIGLVISYDGTNYCGWQRQKNGISVQQMMEDALFKLTGKETGITGAGRTDAGVHALSQTAHFDTDASVPPDKYSYALNTLLPEEIRVRRSFAVSGDFHARYDAKVKKYIYNVWNDRHACGIHGRFTLHEPCELDIDEMKKAALMMCGTHDYSAFCATGAQTKTFTRTVFDISVEKKGELITFTYTGSGFLYNMVRIMTGTLLNVGKGKTEAKSMPEIIKSKDRRMAGPTVPAKGLFLAEICYENV